MPTRRGIALITTLLLCGVLLVMMVGLILRARTQSTFSLESHGSLAALYAAEAGLAETMSRFTADATWSTDLTGTLPYGEASYGSSSGRRAR